MNHISWFLFGGLTFGPVLAAVLFWLFRSQVRARAFEVAVRAQQRQAVSPELGDYYNQVYRPEPRRRWSLRNRKQDEPQPAMPPRPVFETTR
jgi:hypothetical protein